MTPEQLADQLAARQAGGLWYRSDEAAAELRRLAAENAQLLEALKSANLFLHHCWCDVQMNEYSYEKLQQEMAAIDAAMQKEADHG